MLMCAVNELEAGWVVGASVLHPRRSKTQLLAPNTELTAEIIATLKRLKVDRVWVTSDAVEDFDHGASRALTREQRGVYEALMDDFAGRSKTTISNASVKAYRQRINQLLMTAISNRKYASLSARMCSEGDALFAHAASVAYLCVVCGLELEPYIARERSRLTADKAADHTALGLAGLLHDIGKTNCDHEVRTQHEIHLTDHDDEDAYRDHAQVGYEMLSGANAPASVRVAVRMHHQRWDGSGWPDAEECGIRDRDRVDGRTIHVFSRIVAAANTLDNLMHDGAGNTTVPVRALHAFASSRFEGWFDPTVRSALLRAVQPFAVGSRVVLTDGRACAVAAPNPKSPCLPSVQELEQGSPIIDLATDVPGLRIARHEGEDVSPFFYEPTPTPKSDIEAPPSRAA